jgi:hypothetical protein
MFSFDLLRKAGARLTVEDCGSFVVILEFGRDDNYDAFDDAATPTRT